jgi:uncharacterized protein (DUF1015 family)
VAEVRPFRGLRFDPEVVGDLGRVLAPPYDVVDQEREAALRDSSPFNAVWVERGAYAEGDVDRYPGSARTLVGWRESGALVRDTAPSFYLVEDEFTHEGRQVTRTELMGLAQLTPWSEGLVLPHENTRGGPKRDRLDLMRAVNANLSPLMALYSDAGGAVKRAVEEGRPSTSDQVTAADGNKFRVSVITGDGADAVARTVSSAGSLYVADGHHRYETALDFRAEAKAAGWSGNAIDHVMVSLVSIEDEGLISLPYHRMLSGLSAEASGRFARQMDVYFESERIDVGSATVIDVLERFWERSKSAKGPILAVLDKEDVGTMRFLRPRGGREEFVGLMHGRSAAWSKLSPCVFEDVLLRPSLGMNQLEAEAAGFFSYPSSAEEAVTSVREGSRDYAVLLDGVSLRGMTEASEQGERLPPKSTFFYPKLPTGIVFNTLEGDI